MSHRKHILLALYCGISAIFSQAQQLDSVPAELLQVMKFRNIGPASTGGRIVDIAVNPKDKSEYYIAAAYGGVWKTTNSGASFSPVFDSYGTQSIGCVAIDAKNPNVVWVGTGENNNQRSVGYGNGVYLSVDGGKSFTNVGLKQSEHIGMIKIDPRNSNVVYVAAYGPLWKDGGDRGVYKTEDAGKTWKRIQYISDKTGCNEIHFDPADPNTLYATFHQRRRHEWTYLGGGPESAVYKSTDGGNTWRKLAGGLPGGDLGRISLAITPAAPDRIVAMVEEESGKGGMYASYDKGESWTKMNGTYTSGNYYVELIADDKNPDRIFIMDTWLQWSLDGGKTVKSVGEKWKHVDNHAIWIDPDDGRHWRVGCDGGLYETFDNGESWKFLDNIPLTQFYRVACDNASPWYHVYGGTQDNNTVGGPAANGSANGIPNSEWFITVGGDGFKSQVDPQNPDIVYSQWQYGGLIRFDKKTGERQDIKPQPEAGVKTDRWNWDSPLLISSHDPKRLYFAGDKVYRSDDRGNTWKCISNDLTSGIDRNKLPVMGRVWSMDAVAINKSTSIYGNIVYLAESPLDENMLVAGTDDGLIQITRDGGKNWSKISKLTGVPDMTYVSSVAASGFNKDVLYAAFDNHRMGDFKPYLLRSSDGGKTWTNIASNLPANGSIKCFVEDFKDKNLLFAGTEFGFYVSINGGAKWTAWKSGLPPIAIKDVVIQKRENDLVLATFGRGFAVLDDYSLLRGLNKEHTSKTATIFPVKKAQIFIPKTPFGGRGKGNKGEAFYTAPNPESGAVITYYLSKEYKTLKELRQAKEKELQKQGKNTPWPSADTIRLEAAQEKPFLLFVIYNAEDKEVRRLKAPASKGYGRITWDLRFASTTPLSRAQPDLSNPYVEPDFGPFVSPGTYTVRLFLFQNGEFESLNASSTVACDYLVPPTNTSLSESERFKAIDAFGELRRNVTAADDYLRFVQSSIASMKRGMFSAGLDMEVAKRLNELDGIHARLSNELRGDAVMASHEFETEPGIADRIDNSYYSAVFTTNGPTNTHVQQMEAAKTLFDKWLVELKGFDEKYTELCHMYDVAKVPYTPGRKFFLK